MDIPYDHAFFNSYDRDVKYRIFRDTTHHQPQLLPRSQLKVKTSEK
jgi:hypothetical protein